MEADIVDVNSVLKELLPILQRLLDSQVQVQLRLQPHVDAVRIDLSQLHQIILNLAANARDAMPDGGVLTIDTSNRHVTTSDLRGRHHCRPGHYVLIRVTDSGCGMEPETLARIFEPFFTTKERDRGTGMGLSAVYGIVSRFHGFIDVMSSPGTGTTFHIFFPKSTLGLSPQVIQENGKEEDPHGSESILVVDDESVLRELVRQVLSARGYSVVTSESAEAALQWLRARKTKINLLLTDVVLPGMSGADLSREARRIDPSMQVLYMSGYPDVHQRSQMSSPATDAVLSPTIMKPFTSTSLARHVRMVLDWEISGLGEGEK